MKNILPQDGELYYDPHFIEEKMASHLFSQIALKTQWRTDSIKMFGKTSLLPRLTAWYGDPEADYSYSGIKMEPLPWYDDLKKLKEEIEVRSGHKFNSVLLNYYRHGKDYMSWHSDDEKVLGPEPFIASLSLGERRRFLVRHRKVKELPTIELLPESGSLIFMGGVMQKYWHHKIASTSGPVGERIDLTFRFIRLH